MRRSVFLVLVLLNAACGTPVVPADSTPTPTPTPEPTEGRVRVVTGNLSSGNKQSWDEGPGARLLEGVDPDVALLQEMNIGDNSLTTMLSWVEDTFGPEFSVVREQGAQIPNAVVSRWPILDSGVWVDPQVSNRSLVWARINVPGPRDLWAVSVHFLTSNATERELESQALVARIQQTVPSEDLLVIGGDFNTNNRAETCLTTLQQVVVTEGPYPVDELGNDNTNADRSKPYDHVLPDDDLWSLRVSTDLPQTTHPDGLVVDTRVHTPLSELAPAQADDSAAPQMQHMAVVRDFYITAN